MTRALGRAAGPAVDPGARGVVTRWARRWPYATACLIGITIWFASSAILAALIPAAAPVAGMIGYVAGMVVGTPVAGLKGTRGWVVAPVITLGIAPVLGGLLALLGVHLP